MIRKYVFLLTLLCVSFNFTGQEGVDSLNLPDKVVIGVMPTPPFIMSSNEGYKGLSVDSWELVNDELDLEYKYKEYESLGALLKGVENNEVDFSINPVTVTNSRMERMDFSQPYYISDTAMAQKTGSKILGYIKNIISWKFISAILVLIAVILIFGFLVWVFERKKNPEEFGGGKRGILEGFWWSAVTMTTVGYGDKSPQTTGGRIVGFIWMFMAIIIISSLTAAIASSLTVQTMNNRIGGIQDLSNFKVSTVKSSSAEELLDLYNIKYNLVKNEKEGIALVENEKTEVFIYDEPILNFEIDRRELGDEIGVSSRSLKKDYFAYSFPKNSKLVDKINPVLISILKTMEWNNLVKESKKDK